MASILGLCCEPYIAGISDMLNDTFLEQTSDLSCVQFLMINQNVMTPENKKGKYAGGCTNARA